MSDIEYSVVTSDVIKSFDCIQLHTNTKDSEETKHYVLKEKTLIYKCSYPC